MRICRLTAFALVFAVLGAGGARRAAADSIELTSPNGSERWLVGSTYNITWTADLSSGLVKIEYSSNGGTSWSVLKTNTPNDGSEPWTVPNIPSAMCLVRVSDALNGSLWDTSDSWFRVEPENSWPLIVTKTSGEIIVTFLQGSSSREAYSEIGFGYAGVTTPPEYRHILFQGLPHNPSPTTEQSLGFLPAGSELDFYVLTTRGTTVVSAYSGFRPNETFSDMNGDNGLGDTAVTVVGGQPEAYLLHLDRSTGGIDDDNDFLVEVRVVGSGESPPVAVVQTPSGVQSGDVRISYTLKDGQDDVCTISVLFSENGGLTWSAATRAAGGDGTANLTSSRTGQNHVFVWDSVADIGQTSQNDIRIRITPSDTEVGTPGETSNFSVNNVPPPELSCSPNSLRFDAVEGGPNPAYGVIEVWNSGGGPLDWEVNDDASWLTLSPSSGQSTGEKDEVRASVTIGGLAPGVYDATITVSCLQLPGATIEVPVRLTVSELVPLLSVSPEILNFSAWEGGENPPPQNLEIRNAGGHDMPWRVWASMPWVRLSPESGSSTGEIDTVEVSVDVTGLPTGSYAARVWVATAAAANSPQIVTVLLEITEPPPLLSVSPAAVALTCTEGENPNPEYFIVQNVGTGEFSWEVSDDAEWLSVSPASGSNSGEADSVEVRAEVAAFSPGTYAATITVTATTVNSPQEVSVTLVVRERPPTIRVSPTVLQFSCFEGGENPPPQVLRVSNAGRGEMDWEASRDMPWLGLSPGEGTSTGEEDAIEVSVDIAGLAQGSYAGHVTISSAAAINSSVVIPVLMEILEPPPLLEVTPLSLDFHALEDGENPPPQEIRVRNKGGGEMAWDVSSDAAWLSVVPGSGSSSGQEDVVDVSVEVSALSPGTYGGTLTVRAEGAVNSPQSVRVTLVVAESPPVLAVSPLNLSFAMDEGGAEPAPQTLSIWNEGGTAMEWLVSADEGWVRLSPESGTNTGSPETVQVSITSGGMAPGDYTARLTVEAPGAGNSPRTVWVTLVIRALEPELHVSPELMDFSTRRGGGNPPSKTLTIVTSGVTWQVEEDADWLSASPSTGTNQGEEDAVAVSINKAGLDLGTYESQIVVRDVQRPAFSASVQVVLRVVPIRVREDYATIQAGIDAAEERDVILVEEGTYREKIRMKRNVDVLGEGAERTVIDCEGQGTGVAFERGGGARLEGFTITGGTGEPFSRGAEVGGGIYILRSSPRIEGCRIVNNSAVWGGGICIDEDSNPVLVDCEICDNSAVTGGGLFFYEESSATILTTKVSGNSADWYGGGLCLASSSAATIRGCEISGNEASYDGGGIHGGFGCDVDLVSCTIVDNSSPEGAAIFVEEVTTLEVVNTIIWGNVSPMVLRGDYRFRHCDADGSYLPEGNGNISVDPLFAGAADYHLLPCSPCVDRGLNLAVGLPPTDLDGEARIMEGTIGAVTDIGADEVNPDVPTVLMGEVSPRENGLVNVNYILCHVLSMPCSVMVEYSRDGGRGWNKATRAAEGEGTFRLSSSPCGEVHVFAWDSVADVGGVEAENVLLRVTAVGAAEGESRVGAPFSLDNRGVDPDNDKLPDAWEQMIVEEDLQDNILSPGDVSGENDFDGDGRSNRSEYLAGTSPVDRRSYLRLLCTRGLDGEAVVSWPSVRGKIYRLLYSDGLENSWGVLSEAMPGTGSWTEFRDEAARETPLRFYKIEVQ